MRLLDRNRRLREDFQNRCGTKYELVHEFFEAHHEDVKFVNLIKIMADFMVLVNY